MKTLDGCVNSLLACASVDCLSPMQRQIELPNEILLKILKSLSWTDRKSAMEVCMQWRGVVLSTPLMSKIATILMESSDFTNFLEIFLQVRNVKLLHIFRGRSIVNPRYLNVLLDYKVLSKSGRIKRHMEPSFSWCKFQSDDHYNFSKAFHSDEEKALSKALKRQTDLRCMLINMEFNEIYLPNQLNHLHIHLCTRVHIYMLNLIADQCSNLQFLNLVVKVRSIEFFPADLISKVGRKLKVFLLRFTGLWTDNFTAFEECQQLECFGIECRGNLNIEKLLLALSKIKTLRCLFLKNRPNHYHTFKKAFSNPSVLFPNLTHFSLFCNYPEMIEMINKKMPNLRSITLRDLYLNDDNLDNLVACFLLFPCLRRVGIGQVYSRQKLMLFLEKLLKVTTERCFDSVCLCFFKDLNRYQFDYLDEHDKHRIIDYINANFSCFMCEPQSLSSFTCECIQSLQLYQLQSVTPFVNI